MTKLLPRAAIQYLNQFLTPEEQLLHHHWDMARCNKTATGTVLKKLEAIAKQHVQVVLENLAVKSLAFRNWKSSFHFADFRPSGSEKQWMVSLALHVKIRLSNQLWCHLFLYHKSGVVRVNCVDCLDRTNTAQFMVGLCAIRYQLYELGVFHDTEPERIPFDSPACRLLEEVAEHLQFHVILIFSVIRRPWWYHRFTVRWIPTRKSNTNLS